MIQHNWSQKSDILMREKHAGKKTKTREVRNPEQEFEEAKYLTADGDNGVPVGALKMAILTAAHKDIGIEKTLVRKALFIVCDDAKNNLRMDCSEPRMVEDHVRVGAGSADLRYRPYFDQWALTVTFEIDGELLTTGDVISLVDRAGFGVGIGDWRPEKSGEHGRFQVDRTFPDEEEEIESQHVL